MKRETKDKSAVGTKDRDYKKNDKANTKVESDTGKRPEKDTNPLPPNPNKVDNH